jgi:hypothetical protein
MLLLSDMISTKSLTASSILSLELYINLNGAPISTDVEAIMIAEISRSVLIPSTEIKSLFLVPSCVLRGI